MSKIPPYLILPITAVPASRLRVTILITSSIALRLLCTCVLLHWVSRVAHSVKVLIFAPTTIIIFMLMIHNGLCSRENIRKNIGRNNVLKAVSWQHCIYCGPNYCFLSLLCLIEQRTACVLLLFLVMPKVVDAEVKLIENAIRCGGLAPTKAACIKNLLNCLLEKKGKLCLEYLRDLSVDEIKKELSQFKGIGPKTVFKLGTIFRLLCPFIDG